MQEETIDLKFLKVFMNFLFRFVNKDHLVLLFLRFHVLCFMMVVNNTNGKLRILEFLLLN
jgi:hypothetical protein